MAEPSVQGRIHSVFRKVPALAGRQTSYQKKSSEHKRELESIMRESLGLHDCAKHRHFSNPERNSHGRKRQTTLKK